MRRLTLVPAEPQRRHNPGAFHATHTDHSGAVHAAHWDTGDGRSGGGPRVPRVTKLPGGASIVVTCPASYLGGSTAYVELRTPGRRGATDRIAVRGADRAEITRAVDRLKASAAGGQHYPVRNPDEDVSDEKKRGKRLSKAEAKKLAARYDQLTLTETGDPKKDYIRVPLFNPAVRPNLDTPIFPDGIMHPIRSSRGYDESIVRQRARERERRGISTVEQQAAAMDERYQARKRGVSVKEDRLGEKLYQLQEERDVLKDELDNDPAAALVAFVGEHGKARSERGLIPFGEVRKLGFRPEKYRTAVVTQGPHKYLKWEYFLDDLAGERGYEGAEDLLRGIRRAKEDQRKLRRLDDQIGAARAELAATRRRNPWRRGPGLIERFLRWLRD